MRTLSIRVPASTSNLGPGFDLIGLALSLFLEVRARPTGRAGGFITVMVWDRAYPDRRDVMVLGVLPVRERRELVAGSRAQGGADQSARTRNEDSHRRAVYTAARKDGVRRRSNRGRFRGQRGRAAPAA